MKFEDPVGSADRRDARREEGLDKGKDLPLIGAEVDRVEGRPVEEAARDLERRPDVEYAVPDRLVYPSGYADEPRFGELWGLDNTGQAVNGGAAGAPDVDVNAKEASAVTQGDPNVVVAVIDDGVDLSHPDLSGRGWANPGESGADNLGRSKDANGVDDDGNGYVDDVDGWDFANKNNTVYDPGEGAHGTHAASTIAASVNGEGIAGVAPGAKIMALKFMGPSGGAVSDAISAMGYAKAKGARIANASWGYRGSPDPALADAIKTSGMLFVAASGNGGTDAVGDDNDADPNNSEYPASYDLPNVVSVAAVNNRGDMAAFSNYGATTVDLVAPGVDVLGAIPGTPGRPGAALSAVGTTGKALVAGFGAEEIETAAGRASFARKALGAVGRVTEPVVLVDDDRSGAGLPDAGPALSEAIRSATGEAPEVIRVANGDGPALAGLGGKVVVWATGQAYSSGSGATTLTANDQNTLTNFLNGGGKLALTGMDALYRIEGSAFVKGTLLLDVRGDVGSTAFGGSAGTAFAGEAYRFGGPLSTPGYHDEVAPAAGSSGQRQGAYPGAPASWAFRSGTSSAAPHAAGSAALLASVRPELLADPAALRKVLLDAAKPAPATAGRTATGRMVDALAVVRSDATAPTVTGTAPAPGAVDVPIGGNVEAIFSEEMDPATVGASAFALVKQGTTTPAPAAVGYDPASKKAVLDPDADLAYGSTYNATVRGGASGVKDRAGNALAADKSWSFTVAAPPDDAAPDTTIDSGPLGTVRSRTAGFAFSSTEPGSSFRCSLDGVAFADCASPKSYAGLSDGAHTFRVAATDAAGNADPTPASRSFAVDATAPTIGSTVPVTDDPRVPVAADVEAVFSEEMDPGTLTGATFSLVKQGATTPVAAALSYDAATKRATLNPDVDLASETVYTASIKGGTPGAKDLAGNPLAADKAWSFTTADVTAPDTRIDSGPSGTVNARTADFAFSSTEPQSSFECSLDGSVFEVCASPKGYGDLEDGLHSFKVKAIDAQGNADVTPASRAFTVDAAPTVVSRSPEPGATNVPCAANVVVGFSEKLDPATVTDATLILHGQDGDLVGPVPVAVTYDPATRKATLDPASDPVCNATYHRVEVVGQDVGGSLSIKDEAGNPLAVTEYWDFHTSDTLPPGTPSIDLHAASDSGVSNTDRTTNDTTPTLGGFTEFDSTVKVYDGATLLGTTTATGSARTVGEWEFTPANSLADGTHRLSVTSTDAAGNTSPSATINVTVDTASPTAAVPVESLISPSQLGTTAIPVKLGWSATDGAGSGVVGYRVEQSTNGGAYSAVGLPTAASTSIDLPLAPGSTYRFRAGAQDAAGNWSAWAEAPSFALSAPQENGAGVTYPAGTWTSVSSTSFYGGAVKYVAPTALGPRARYAFTGSEVAFVTTKGNRGKAEVWVDGVKQTTLDLYASTTQVRQVAYRKVGLDPAVTHTIEVRPTGTKNASNTSSSGTRVDVDAFVSVK